MRLTYPSNIRIVKVPCTGRVAIIHLMKAIEKGADGVFVAGCMEGDCHFQAGNLRAKKRVTYVRQLLQSIGMEPDRVAMYNLSSGEGPRFAEISREMTDKIRQLGPNPVRAQGARKAEAA
ncbi:MvhD-family protein [Syntrophobacter sp. SbD2]|nr:MvhD-family protein [Syntrophobacter sp. SbD2]